MIGIPLSIAQIGLIFDIVGALLLGYAIALSRFKQIAEIATGGYLVYNKNLLLSLCQQKVDAIFGLAMLVFGFGLQLFSPFAREYVCLKMILIIVCMLVTAVYVIARGRIANVFLGHAERAYWTMHPREDPK